MTETDNTTFIRFDKSRPVAIVGLGVMGSLVAWACARAGIPMRGYDQDKKTADNAQLKALSWGSREDRQAVEENFLLCSTLEEALEGAQLTFENVPEVMEIKTAVLSRIGEILDPHAYMGSNASSFICTPLAEASGRPQRFFNMNFNDPRSCLLVELMGCPETHDSAYRFAEDWAQAVGMATVRTHKEQMGYSLNRLWRVIKKEVLRQIAEGYATPDSIDRAWMLNFGTNIGPCGVMDIVSMPSVLKVEEAYYKASGDPTDKPPQFLYDMAASGALGEASGKGFYTYPDPAFKDPDWLLGRKED